MPRLTKEQWETIRAEREAGCSFPELAARHGVSHQAIQKRAKKGGWSGGEDVAEVVRRKVAERVAGLQPKESPEKRAAAMDAEADKVAEVVRRHRDETNAIRDRLYNGLKQHKAAENYAAKRLAFEDLKAAKISSECLQNIHRMERTAWGIDDAAQAGGQIKIRWAGGEHHD